MISIWGKLALNTVTLLHTWDLHKCAAVFDTSVGRGPGPYFVSLSISPG